MNIFRKFRDQSLLLTHTSPQRFNPGEVFQWREGEPHYRITRVRQIAPTKLLDKGIAPCWEVRGVPIIRQGE